MEFVFFSWFTCMAPEPIIVDESVHAATKGSTGGTFMTRKQAELSKIKLHRAAGNV
jgi:hypothetical protein